MADLIKILHRHSTIKNKVPNLDAVNKREVAISHVSDSIKGPVNVVPGLFIRTGPAAVNNSNDKIMRVGGALVTDNGLRPDQIVSNSENIDWTGEHWLDKSVDPFVLYLNVNGLPTGWRPIGVTTPGDGDGGGTGNVDGLLQRIEELEVIVGGLGNIVANNLAFTANIYVNSTTESYATGVTYAQLKDDPDLQVNDPLAANFRALNTLAEAGLYCAENVSSEGVATLFLKPGLHYSNANFNCSIVINGVDNEGTVGDYDDLSSSVILHQKYIAGIGTRVNGDRILSSLQFIGTLTINSAATSSIKNIVYWSALDHLAYLGKTPQTYLIDVMADQTILESVNNGVDINAFVQPKIRIRNGKLIIDGLTTFGPHCPSGSNAIAFEESSVGMINVVDATLQINACRLRGNLKYIIPTSIFEPIRGESIPIYKAAATGYAKCNSTGVLNTGAADSGFRIATGFTRSLIGMSGDCQLSLGKGSYTQNLGVDGINEVGNDKNNIRLERTWSDLFGTTDTNLITGLVVTPDAFSQGSDNLGLHEASTIFSNAKAPSIAFGLDIYSPKSKLTLDSAIWRPSFVSSNSLPGFRGTFGSVANITTNGVGVESSISYTKTVSIKYFPLAFAITLDEGFSQQQNTLWVSVKATNTPRSDVPSVIESELNILTTKHTAKFYLNAEECTDIGYYNGVDFTATQFTTNFTW